MTSAQIEKKLIDIVRRDLKLADEDWMPDQPLDADALDLDSLDFLMLVASIEKDLGVKIPNEQLGAETFRDLRTLVTVVSGLIAS